MMEGALHRPEMVRTLKFTLFSMHRALWMMYSQHCVKVLGVTVDSRMPAWPCLESAKHLVILQVLQVQSYWGWPRKQTRGGAWSSCIQLEVNLLSDCSHWMSLLFCLLQRILFSPPVHVAEEVDRGALQLTFDLPQSPLLKLNPVLLLALGSPLTGEDLDVTFTSQSLQPNTQVKRPAVTQVSEKKKKTAFIYSTKI